MNENINSAIRAFLNNLSGFLIAFGFMNEKQSTALVGIGISTVSLYWTIRTNGKFSEEEKPSGIPKTPSAPKLPMLVGIAALAIFFGGCSTQNSRVNVPVYVLVSGGGANAVELAKSKGIDIRNRSKAFFDSKNELAKYKVTTSVKTNVVTVSIGYTGLEQEASATNLAEVITATGKAVGEGAAAFIKNSIK